MGCLKGSSRHRWAALEGVQEAFSGLEDAASLEERSESPLCVATTTDNLNSLVCWVQANAQLAWSWFQVIQTEEQKKIDQTDLPVALGMR